MTSNTINTAGLLSRLFLICVITCEAACSHDEILQEKDPPKCIEQVKPDLGNSGCGDGQRFVQGRCQQERCDADETTPELCCGGQVCDGGGSCAIPQVRIEECDDDAGCTIGQKCLLRPLITSDDSTNSKSCGWPKPTADNICEPGYQLFNERCVKEAPCNGQCGSGKVCNIDTNSCESPPSMTGSDTTSCTQNCKAGELLVYASPNTMLFDGCCELSCECSTLPDINLGIWGAYSDLVTTPDNRIFASAYNETFGDLVVVEYDSTGTVKAVDFVDGIPTSGTAVANPAGPRNGLQDGGPNVGTHTAIATDGTSLFVAYHDEDTHRLKFAVRELATKNWNVSYITDQSEGDVGYYSSIALEGSTPHLSYYAHRIPGSPISTGVYYAVPNQSAPTSPDNWTKTPIETYQGCGQACGESKECVGMDQGPACQTPSSSCPSACGCDEICVGTTCRPKRPEFIDLACPSGCGDEQECVLNDGVPSCGSLDATCEDCTDPQFACVTNAQGQPSCLEIIAVSTLRDLPQGVGLFSSIAIVSGEPHIVYYDRFNKSLRGASGLGNFSPVALACQDKTTIDADLDVDVGQQSTIVPNTNRDSMAILYQLDAGRQLRTLLAADMATAQITLPETSDNGERIGQNSPKRFVGAYVDGVYQNDRLFIAYQDQTQNDLVINTRETGHWRTPVAVLSEGAYGRYANIAVFGEKLVVSTYRYEFDENSSNQSGLVVQVIDPAQYFTIE